MSIFTLFSTTLVPVSSHQLISSSPLNVVYSTSFRKSFEVSLLHESKNIGTHFSESGELNIFVAEFNYSADWIKKLTTKPSKYDMYEKAFEISQFTSRHVSMPGNNETRDLIESYLANIGISYSELWFSVNYSGKVYHTANIVVNVSQIDPTKETILLLAHYDSLSFDFRDRPYPEKAPGADDDLSGVIALLYFIKNMKAVKSLGFSKNVIAVFLSGEEDNYVGSRIILSLFSNITTIDSVIYIDEVGKAGTSLAIFYGNLINLLESTSRVNATLSLSIKDMKSPRDSSFVGCGESVFVEQNIPTLVLSETNYDNIDTHRARHP